MTAVPSARLVGCALLVGGASLGVLVFPAAGLALLAANLRLAGAALLDWLLSPGAHQIEVARLAPEQMSVLDSSRVTLRVRNRSRAALRVRLRDAPPESFDV